MTRKKRRALLCMLAVPLLALAPRSEESLPASAAEPAAVPEKYVALTFDDGPWPETTEQLLETCQQSVFHTLQHDRGTVGS